jgi:hypothetical protein
VQEGADPARGTDEQAEDGSVFCGHRNPYPVVARCLFGLSGSNGFLPLRNAFPPFMLNLDGLQEKNGRGGRGIGHRAESMEHGVGSGESGDQRRRLEERTAPCGT